jgi:PIN domain nuclease of toxin-antitoxin system
MVNVFPHDAGRADILSITLNHVLTLDSLPHHHKDPFDRLLVAQAISEGAVLVSRDAVFSNYPVKVEW